MTWWRKATAESWRRDLYILWACSFDNLLWVLRSVKESPTGTPVQEDVT